MTRLDRRTVLVALLAAGPLAQLGHLLSYLLRFGPDAAPRQSSGVHHYFPTLLTSGAAALGAALLAGLLLIALARFMVGLRNDRVPDGGRPVLPLLLVLLAIQLGVYWSQELAEGFAHQFVGLVMMIPAFLLILLVCWLLDHVFLDEVDEQERERLRMGGGRGGERKVVQIQRPAAAVARAATSAGTAVARGPAMVPPARAGAFPRAAGARPAAQAPVAPQAAKPQAAKTPAKPQPGQGPQPQGVPQAPKSPSPQAAKSPQAPQPAPQQGRQQK